MMEFLIDKVNGEEVIDEMILPVSNLLWPPTQTSTVGQDGKSKSRHASTVGIQLPDMSGTQMVEISPIVEWSVN